MTAVEMESKVKELRELRRMQDELTREIEALTDLFKLEMNSKGVDTLTGTDWKATWKEVTSNRIDTTALKKAMPDVAAAFTKSNTSRRFLLA